MNPLDSTTENGNILAFVDGSIYTDSVCDHAAWAAKQLEARVRILHVQTSGTNAAAVKDLSGSIGLGAKSALLEKLAQVDEAQGRLDQQRGRVILEHAKEQVVAAGIAAVETMHRRGSLSETISEMETDAQLLVLGKRGEDADFDKLHLGSNLERAVRSAHKPVLVASRAFKKGERFVIAYDGGSSTRKAVDYLVSNPLLRGMACHLLKVGANNAENQRRLEEATLKLRDGGYDVTPQLIAGDADEVIAAYVAENEMSILVMGAYGHTRIRNMIIGSTTSNMLRSCPIPVLMFR
ncbi:MAG: universal stress protein [Caldilineaceae bacterium]|nr:universal stress protein [Caldilineaceae bacterium]